MDNFDHSAYVMYWVFIMCVFGLPFFIYETTSAPYYVVKAFGFDIVVAAMAVLSLGGFLYLVVKKH